MAKSTNSPRIPAILSAIEDRAFHPSLTRNDAPRADQARERQDSPHRPREPAIAVGIELNQTHEQEPESPGHDVSELSQSARPRHWSALNGQRNRNTDYEEKRREYNVSESHAVGVRGLNVVHPAPERVARGR